MGVGVVVFEESVEAGGGEDVAEAVAEEYVGDLGVSLGVADGGFDVIEWHPGLTWWEFCESTVMGSLWPQVALDGIALMGRNFSRHAHEISSAKRGGVFVG